MNSFEPTSAGQELVDAMQAEAVKRLDAAADPRLLSSADRQSIQQAIERLRASIRRWEAQAAQKSLAGSDDIGR